MISQLQRCIPRSEGVLAPYQAHLGSSTSTGNHKTSGCENQWSVAEWDNGQLESQVILLKGLCTNLLKTYWQIGGNWKLSHGLLTMLPLALASCTPWSGPKHRWYPALMPLPQATLVHIYVHVTWPAGAQPSISLCRPWGWRIYGGSAVSCLCLQQADLWLH